MTYQIRKYDGTLLVDLGNGFTDSVSSSLTFIGKNVSNFGEIQNNNFLHLLENFSGSTAPLYKLGGQLWFNSNTKTLNLYNNTSWQNVALVTYSANSSESVGTGNLWFDTTNKQLYINTGTGFSLIGPDGAPDSGATRMISDRLPDTSEVLHAVIKGTVNGDVVAIFSQDSFDINTTATISGFTHVYKGITLKNGNSYDDAQLYGWSEYSKNSNALLIEGTTSYGVASTSTTANTLVQRNSQGNITASGINVTAIVANTSGSISGTWSITDGLVPDTNGGASLGTTGLRWSNVYAQSTDVSTVNATTVKFATLTDSALLGITRFDTDPLLAANSDARLATQRAIKRYIDDAVSTEISLRLSGDANLQTQIDNIPNSAIPPGAVFHVAGTTVPTGFLAASGQSVAKNTYPALYAALGSGSSPYGQTDTTFKLPDLRGEFIRGWDNSRGVDASRAIGSAQTDMLKSHNHRILDNNNATFGGDAPNAFDSAAAINQNNSSYVDTQLTGGAETRPRNVALLAIIKF